MFEKKLLEKIINEVSEKAKILLPREQEVYVRKDPYAIADLKNPFFSVQKVAVTLEPLSIAGIKNPSEEIQVLAVSRNPAAVDAINGEPCAKAKEIAALNGFNSKHSEKDISVNKEKVDALIKLSPSDPEFKKGIMDLPVEVIEYALNLNPYALMAYKGEPPIESQRIAVKKDGNTIKFIDKPNEEIQMTAVLEKPSAIEYISKPTQKVQNYVAKTEPTSILLVKNPTIEALSIAAYYKPSIVNGLKDIPEEVFNVALNRDPSVLKDEINKNETVQKIALRKDPSYIVHIDNPSEDLIAFALDMNPMLLRYFPNTSAKIIQNTVENDYKTIQFIENPSVDLQKIVLEKDPAFLIKTVKDGVEDSLVLEIMKEKPELMTYIEKPSEKLQISAMSGNRTDAIRYINNPTENIEKLAIKLNPSNMEYIKDPSYEMLTKAMEKNPSVIKYVKDLPLEKIVEKIKAYPQVSQYFLKSVREKREVEENLERSPHFETLLRMQRMLNSRLLDSRDEEIVKETLERNIISGQEKIEELEKEYSKDNVVMRSLKNTLDGMEKAAETGNIKILEKYRLTDEQLNEIEKSLRNEPDYKNFIKTQKTLEDLMSEIVKTDPAAIQYIPSPSQKIKENALKAGREAIPYIGDLTSEQKQLVVESDPYAIKYLSQPYYYVNELNPDQAEQDRLNKENKEFYEKLKKIAVSKNPFAVRFVEYPSESLLSLAVKLDPYVVADLYIPKEEFALMEEDIDFSYSFEEYKNAPQYSKGDSKQVLLNEDFAKIRKKYFRFSEELVAKAISKNRKVVDRLSTFNSENTKFVYIYSEK